MINLIPNELRLERLYGRRNRQLVTVIVVFLAAALMVALIMIGSLRFVGADESSLITSIEENELLIAELELQTNDLSKVSSRLDSTYKLYQNSIAFSELIPEIGSLLPQGSVINGLSLTGGNTDPLDLDVSLVSADLVPVLLKNLKDSELFEAADVIVISPGGSNNNYEYGASVSVSFTGSAEAKRKAAAAAAAAAAATKEINDAEAESQ